MEISLGIDLGTTYSAVAFVDETGNPSLIKNLNGSTLTPSVVYFDEINVIVGAEAKEMQKLGEENVAAFFKRDMGNLDFSLTFDAGTYSAEQISTFVLSKLKQDAEIFLNQPVKKAVITVPAYFNNLQREATIRAGKGAGLDVIRIINEPTAAAIAYGVNLTKDSTILVYDLGGGTFDVTLMKVEGDVIEVLATDGDHELGGKDWDDKIVQYICSQFEEEFGEDPLEDSVTFNDILVRSEAAKRQLTTRMKARVSLTHKGEKGNYEISRSTFEELTKDLLERTQLLTNGLLEELSMSWEEIDGTLLVGGSTRMPMVSQWVTEMSGKDPLRGVNVDEAVAIGAALQASLDTHGRIKKSGEFFLGGTKTIKDVMSHSLGLIAINEDKSQYVNSIIIPKNISIPSKEIRPYQLRTRRHTNNSWEAYMTQGESDNPTECQIIGKYVFSEIEHIQEGNAILDISYSYDANGLIQVSAVQRSDPPRGLKMKIESVPADMSWLSAPPEMEEIQQHTSVVFAIDLSGSMSGKPLKEAQKAAIKFIENLDLTHTSVGLLVFADKVDITQGLTQNSKKLVKGITSWKELMDGGKVGYGNRSHPFDIAREMLSNSDSPKFILVLTDGVWSKQEIAIQAAKECKQEENEIIAVGFGGVNRKFLNQLASSDENALLTNQGGLVGSFTKIAQVMTDNSGHSDKSSSKGLMGYFS